MIAIYARVSTEDQAKRGFSLQDQLRECKQKAQTNDVREYVDEGVSGEYLDRPELTRMRSDIRRGLISQVICLDPDRLSRKLMNQLIISDEIESRATLEFVNGEYARTPEGQLFYQMRGAISQFEKAKINERMSRGRREKARQGRILRDFHIYGYDFDTLNDRFVINESEAVIVRLIFELFTDPRGRVKGINGIATYLNNMGIPSKRGSVFHRQVIRQMLMNPAYVGEFYQNKWNTEGMLGNRYKKPEERIRQQKRPQEEWIALSVPALIESQQFHYAQTLLQLSRRRFAGRAKRTYLLSGILRCAQCGNTMVGHKRRNWGQDEYVYTDAKHTAGAKNVGCGRQVKCEVIDKAIWAWVLNWVGPPDGNRLLSFDQSMSHLAAGSDSTRSDSIVQIEKDIERNQIATARLINLLCDSEIDLKVIRDKLKELQLDRANLEQRLELMKQMKMACDDGGLSLAETAVDTMWSELCEESLDLINADAAQALIRTVVREVRVGNEENALEILTL